jgi:hypothetical protein
MWGGGIVYNPAEKLTYNTQFSLATETEVTKGFLFSRHVNPIFSYGFLMEGKVILQQELTGFHRSQILAKRCGLRIRQSKMMNTGRLSLTEGTLSYHPQ